MQRVTPMKRMQMPIWIPYPNAWLSALMISVLMSAFLAIIRRYGDSFSNLSTWSNNPEQSTIIAILLLVGPIPVIAFFHHLFISRFVSPIPGEKLIASSGFFPGLLSWWESLYSWLVIVLSTLIATLICTPFLPLFQLNYAKFIETYAENPSNIRIAFAGIWVLSAAIFYQVSYLFKIRLVDNDSFDEIEIAKNKSKQLEIEEENEIPATPVATTNQATTNSADGSTVVVKQRKSPKTFLNIFVLSLVGAWLYMFFTLPDVQQSISSGNFAEQLQKRISSETRAVNTQFSKISLQSNSFGEALDIGNSAAQLEELASTKEDWNTVAAKWKAALTLMKTVSPENPNFILAEQKMIEYKKKLDVAKKEAVKAE